MDSAARYLRQKAHMKKDIVRKVLSEANVRERQKTSKKKQSKCFLSCFSSADLLVSAFTVAAFEKNNKPSPRNPQILSVCQYLILWKLSRLITEFFHSLALSKTLRISKLPSCLYLQADSYSAILFPVTWLPLELLFAIWWLQGLIFHKLEFSANLYRCLFFREIFLKPLYFFFQLRLLNQSKGGFWHKLSGTSYIVFLTVILYATDTWVSVLVTLMSYRSACWANHLSSFPTSG